MDFFPSSHECGHLGIFVLCLCAVCVHICLCLCVCLGVGMAPPALWIPIPLCWALGLFAQILQVSICGSGVLEKWHA